MDPTQEDPRIGLVLSGRYRITSLLGEGGMGMVYRGERLQLGRPVAIKYLHSPYSRSPKFVARFEREARAMSKLSHPHCVSVIDFGVQDAPYIVMDFVTGATLREVLDQGPMPTARALSISRQVLFGLSHAHSEGVTHRDIKPGNIMLAELAGIGDHVRIFDFGLAKLHDSEQDGDASAAAIVGTPAYMAPEQARAEKIDSRVDLYAVGVVLFEMLAGQKPFQGADAYEVLCLQRDAPPPSLLAQRPDLSQELGALVARALEKDVSKRFQTAEEFVAAIDELPEMGRNSSTERDLASGELGFAKTEEMRAVKVPTAYIDDGSLSTPAAQVKPERSDRGGRAGLWLSGLVVACLGLLGWFALGMRGEGAPAPFSEPAAATARPREPLAIRAPSEESPAATRPATIAPAPSIVAAASETAPALPAEAEGEAPSEHPEELAVAPLAPTTAEEPPVAAAGTAEGAETGENEEASEVDELSADALEEADQALNETTEREVRVTSAPAPAVTTLGGVRALIRQKKLDEAITVIRVMRKKMPKSAELPYMLGDIYFERGWWSDGLAKYREAIGMSGAYRQRVGAQKNAITALGDDRTYARARALLVKDIGRAAVPRLRKAAKSDSSSKVRKRASAALAQILR